MSRPTTRAFFVGDGARPAEEDYGVDMTWPMVFLLGVALLAVAAMPWYGERATAKGGQ